MDQIKDILASFGQIINGIVDLGLENWIMGLIGVGVILLLVVIIIIAIAVPVKKAKKKKAAAKAAAEAVESKSEEDHDTKMNDAKQEETIVADEEVPAEEEPVKEEEPAKEETPAEEVSATEEPVKEETPVEEKTAEEAPVEEPAKEEEPATSAEETPAEEPAKEEATVEEEKPAEEPVKEEKAAPVEEAPAEEKPAEEPVPSDEGMDSLIGEEPEPVVEETQEETIILPEADQKELDIAEGKAEAPKEEKAAKKTVKKSKYQPVAPTPVKEAKGKYVLTQEGPNWRYKLKASNGEVIIVSEPYISEKAVRTGIETLKKNIEIANIEFVEDKHGLFSFRIMTKQGRCLATSANYKTKIRAQSASESYKRWATSENIIVDEGGSGDHTEVEKIEVTIEEENTGTYLVKAVEGGYTYQLIAANKRVIATSQTYKSKDSCIDAIEKFRVCVYDGSFYVFRDKNNKFQFKLYNKQNRMMLAGEVYDDRSRVISVIEAIKRLAKLAKVIVPEDNPQQ